MQRPSARELLSCRPGPPRIDLDCNPDPAIERSENLHPSVSSPFKAPCSETHRIAARDGDSRTGDVGATGSGQKDHESGDLVRLAGTAERYVGVAARRHFRLANALLGRKPAGGTEMHLGAHEPRTDRIAANAVAAELRGDGLAQASGCGSA